MNSFHNQSVAHKSLLKNAKQLIYEVEDLGREEAAQELLARVCSECAAVDEARGLNIDAYHLTAKAAAAHAQAAQIKAKKGQLLKTLRDRRTSLDTAKRLSTLTSKARPLAHIKPYL
jgi:hypothetical protein